MQNLLYTHTSLVTKICIPGQVTGRKEWENDISHIRVGQHIITRYEKSTCTHTQIYKLIIHALKMYVYI
jgi:hypothetical protein